MQLHWLDNQPRQVAGVTWGVPWEQGSLNRNQQVALYDSKGSGLSVQTWPMAFWPDGSVKWTGHAAIFEPGKNHLSYQLKRDHSKVKPSNLTVQQDQNSIQVETGRLACTVHKKGNVILSDIVIDRKNIGSEGKLIAIKEAQQQSEYEIMFKQEKLVGEINKVEIEQSGPIRAVVKIEGSHVSQKNEALFPFVLRLYFYAGIPEFKMVHTFIYDGDETIDFLKGLGMEFTAKLTGEPWNRHVQISGEEGMYKEPGQLLLTRRFQNAGGLYAKQIKGEPVDVQQMEGLEAHVRDNAKWNDFKVIQDSADHYKIVKRTEEGCSWVASTHGTRAKGSFYAGGTNGGFAFGIKDFWQKHPSALEVRNLTEEQSTCTLWLWSPDAEAMDFRHYSKDTHVLSAYEGFDEMRATPKGIANTSELFIRCFSTPPTEEELFKLSLDWQDQPLLVCEPEHYYRSNALGVWSLPNYDHSFTSFLEAQLDHAFQFYKEEVEQRSWYGFWNYGDVMHTYDSVRHQWRYDVGGFAWQNTELVPNIWLWQTFLRTGNVDVFKMAEAMTRHTSEVDRYHSGEYAGLGSRHNVVHWGCGCKEARVSMAGLHKYYYFLTADERTRDLLTEVRDADRATVHLDPMREFFSNDDGYPTHTRVGPDWSAFCSNWLSEWERTENEAYRDKILMGINDLKRYPLRLLSGPTFGYDPETTHLYQMDDGIAGGFHMIIAFGAPQVWMEIASLINEPEWDDMLSEFGEFYSLSDEEKRERSGGRLHDKLFSWPMFAAGMIAFAANKKHNQELANKAWQLLLDEKWSHTPLPIEETDITSWKKLKEIPWVTTNTISQWCVNTIACLEILQDMLPDEGLQKSITVQKKC